MWEFFCLKFLFSVSQGNSELVITTILPSGISPEALNPNPGCDVPNYRAALSLSALPNSPIPFVWDWEALDVLVKHPVSQGVLDIIDIPDYQGVLRELNCSTVAR